MFQDIPQRHADPYIAILINEALLSKFVNEKSPARSDGSNHFGKRLLIDFIFDSCGEASLLTSAIGRSSVAKRFPHQRLSCGWSRRTTFNNELWISMLPL